MYDWLPDSLADNGTVVTANRRLARVLSEEYASQQLSAGLEAWRSPAVYAWQDWLTLLAASATGQATLPTRINAHQSQWLWEKCLRSELGDTISSLTPLVRMARDTWQKLADWQVPLSDVARSAHNDDQRFFAAAAGRYQSMLRRQSWVDDSGLGALVLDLINDERIDVGGHFTFAGFDREPPIVGAVVVALRNCGGQVSPVVENSRHVKPALQSFDNTASELRAAGRWARQRAEDVPGGRVAIIVNGLDRDANGIARLIREGCTPGWQHSERKYYEAVNVSFGQRLSDYPAITIAEILLRWLVQDLDSRNVSLLLRSPLLGSNAAAGRSRLELQIRRLPDRKWSPSMVTSALRGVDDGEEANEWLENLSAFGKRKRELPSVAAPADWVILFDEILKSMGWPGSRSLDSAEFQLINRYRELLNEFARLGLVSETMSARAAVGRIELMAAETIFQPESPHALVQILGPLEAAGAEFDSLWVSGVSTANWPPPGNPSPLISRRLQEKLGMPDSTPKDTLEFATTLLASLLQSSDTLVCSFARSDDDAEQSVSDLLTPMALETGDCCADPGWYATSISGGISVAETGDSVPAVVAGDMIFGGAATIQRQFSDPVGAFAHGRLAAKVLYPQAIGIPAPIRGTLLHDALFKLYSELPDTNAVRSWRDEDLDARIHEAENFAFQRYERNADSVLQQLLRLERQRIATLLREFVAIDGARDPFQVAGVEGAFEFQSGHIKLTLRYDRIDRFDDDSIEIIDYKTGARKKLLDRANEAQEIQLFVYACATKETVAALSLVNVDTREVAFDGAGRGYTDASEWPAILDRVKGDIETACQLMAAGDVRINVLQGVAASRPLNVLTRYTELLHDRR